MKLLLVGAGGYARNYVKLFLNGEVDDVSWEGIVDPFYSACEHKEAIDALHIPVYDTMEEFYSHHTADLAVISTPTFLHCEQSICALSHGSYVLCEKPVAPTSEEAEKMLTAQEQYGRFIAIGYQWSYSKAIRDLKADISSGALGKPLSFKTAVSWPRNRAYYSRGGGWAGRISKNGKLILDSIAANACAHYLHNMLFVLGNAPDTSAEIARLDAECFRANDIENFDTCCIKMETAEGVRLYYAATHAASKRCNPQFVYTFQNATVTYSQDDASRIVAEFSDGRKKIYGDPFENPFQKLYEAVECVKSGSEPICTVKTALPHVKVIQRLYQTTPISNFAPESIYTDKVQDAVFAEGLFETLYKAYENEALLSEISPALFQRENQ